VCYYQTDRQTTEYTINDNIVKIYVPVRISLRVLCPELRRQLVDVAELQRPGLTEVLIICGHVSIAAERPIAIADASCTKHHQSRISNFFQIDVCALCVRYYRTDRQTTEYTDIEVL